MNSTNRICSSLTGERYKVSGGLMLSESQDLLDRRGIAVPERYYIRDNQATLISES